MCSSLTIYSPTRCTVGIAIKEPFHITELGQNRQQTSTCVLTSSLFDDKPSGCDVNVYPVLELIQQSHTSSR